MMTNEFYIAAMLFGLSTSSAPAQDVAAGGCAICAARETIDAEKIASLASHAPMPNPPLTPLGVRDIAQYINELRQ
jgi:hypothetical protein